MSDVDNLLPSPLRFLLLVALFLLSAQMARAEEPVLVRFHDAATQEVQAQGLTLPRAAKVHVYARGGASHGWGSNPLFAYGWILNAHTREVVWQMDGRNTRTVKGFEVADTYLDLPAGSYEVYYAHATFERRSLFVGYSRNIDRRTVDQEAQRRRDDGFIADMGRSQLRKWRSLVENYAMEVYLASGDPAEVVRFQAPLRWDREFLSFTNLQEDEHRRQAFRLKRPMTLHVYAQGERVGSRTFADHGWITDLRSGKRVWEMRGEAAQYGGGSTKNRRQVETIQLPAGDYEAAYVTDDSHTPSDWNAAPPCDPLRYGLTLSLPQAADAPFVALTEAATPGAVLAELVRVGNDADLRAPFTLKAPTTVHILALGEGDGEELADYGWIEDAQGQRVWRQTYEDSAPAGGASKNRRTEARVELPKGTYTLRFVTDDSHAYGRWNSRAPREADRYGITVRATR